MPALLLAYNLSASEQPEACDEREPPDKACARHLGDLGRGGDPGLLHDVRALNDLPAEPANTVTPRGKIPLSSGQQGTNHRLQGFGKAASEGTALSHQTIGCSPISGARTDADNA
jgi:hypothetical protein